METRTYKLSELVFDHGLYPRVSIDPTHAGMIREAVRAGAAMPPLVVERGTRRVVDGFHRGDAYRREGGEDCEVACTEREYASDGEFLLDAVRCNASHGRPLSHYDRIRVQMRLQQFRLGVKAIASALGVRPETLRAVGEGRVAKAADQPQREIPIKRTISHLRGQPITARQEEANEKLSGMPQTWYCNQLLLILEADLLDRENPNVLERLAALHEAIGRVLATVERSGGEETPATARTDSSEEEDT